MALVAGAVLGVAGAVDIGVVCVALYAVVTKAPRGQDAFLPLMQVAVLHVLVKVAPVLMSQSGAAEEEEDARSDTPCGSKCLSSVPSVVRWKRVRAEQPTSMKRKFVRTHEAGSEPMQ